MNMTIGKSGRVHTALLSTAAILLCLTPVWMSAQGIRLGDLDARLVGSWPGELQGPTVTDARDVVISGSHAYLADGFAGLQVIDVSDPSHPVRVGTFDTVGEATYVFASGHLAYLTEWSAGLHVIDVSNPAEPLSVGRYFTTGHARVLAAVDRYVFVAIDSGMHDWGLDVVDVLDPSSPIRVAGYPGSWESAVVNGTLLYLTGPGVEDQANGVVDELTVLDISDPTTPVRVGGATDWFGTMDVEGGRVYEVTGSTEILAEILDITDPVNPMSMGTLRLPRAGSWGQDEHGFAVVEDRVYLTQSWLGMLVVAQFSGSGDIRRVGGFSAGYDSRAVAVFKSHAYVTSRDKGLQVVEFAPANPVRLGSYRRDMDVVDVAVSGDHAYVADLFAGLQVIDVSDPTQPQWVGGYDDETGAPAQDVAVSGDYAYLLRGGLHVLDVSDPSNPVKVSEYGHDGQAYDLALEGGYAYLVRAGLEIIDIADPTRPTRVGNCTSDGNSLQRLTVVGSYAYVVTHDGFQVIDVSDPSAPVPVGGCEIFADSAEDMAVTENHALLATHAGLEVIDISDPTSPVSVGVFDTGVEYTADVSVHGNYAYLAGSLAGLQVLDISDPEHPRRVGGNSAFAAAGVAFHDDKLYVAGRWDGLILLNAYKPLRMIPGLHGLEIHWDRGTLQFAPAIDASWTDLPAASPMPLSPIGEKGFFRLKVPTSAQATAGRKE